MTTGGTMGGATIPPEGPPGRPDTGRIYRPRDVNQMTRRRFNGATPSTVAGVLRNLDMGFYEQWADLCAQIIRDPTVRRAYTTRRAAVVSKPIVVTPADGTPEAKATADYAQRAIKRLDMEALLYRQCDAFGVGLAAHETIWTRERGAWFPDFAPMMTRDLKWEGGWELRFRTRDDQSYRLSITDDHPGKFWVLSPAVQPGLPIDQGDFLAAVWPWLMIGLGYKFWLNAAERFANPMYQGTYPTQSDLSVRTRLRDNLIAMAENAVGMFEEGTKVTVLSPQGQTSAAIWADLVHEFKQEIVFSIVGATDVLTPGSVGALAAVKERRGVMLESTASDSAGALGSLLHGPIAWGLHYSCIEGPLPIVASQFPTSSDPIPPEVIESRVIKNDELRGRFGYDPIGGPWGAAFAQVTPPAPAQAAPGGAPAADPFPAAQKKSPPALGGMPDL